MAVRSSIFRRAVLGGLAGAALALAMSGCGAVYPELGTRTSAMPPERPLDPPPPDGLRWIAVDTAEIPEMTRDGRKWGRMGEQLPDAYARLYVNDVELLRTNPAEPGLRPTFSRKGKTGNFPLVLGDRLRVELWDKDPLNDRAIGRQETRVTAEILAQRRWTARFDMGGSAVILIEPAHPLFGMGFWYELRQKGGRVTRMLANSPAARAGLQPGDALVAIGPTPADEMTADEIRSAMNAPPIAGLVLTVRHLDGAVLKAKITPGPIYPSFAQHGPIE